MREITATASKVGPKNLEFQVQFNVAAGVSFCGDLRQAVLSVTDGDLDVVLRVEAGQVFNGELTAGGEYTINIVQMVGARFLRVGFKCPPDVAIWRTEIDPLGLMPP